MFIYRTGGEEMQNRGTRSSTAVLLSANGCISVRVFQKETGIHQCAMIGIGNTAVRGKSGRTVIV